MSTMTATAPARKPRTVKEPHGVVRLTIQINETTYSARPLAAEDQSFGVVRAVRLRKDDGEVYTVAELVEGHQCDCASFEFDHAGHGTACKHIAALIACGLLAGKGGVR